MTPLNIINVGYMSTNYYVLDAGKSRLLVDVGVPGSFGQLAANLKRMGIELTSIQHLLVTHYHPDHAGIVEEVKAAGVRHIVLDVQRAAIDFMRHAYIKPTSPYIPIGFDDQNSVLVTLAASRGLLKGLGFDGEIIATPGHSDDSVSLVLDEGSAFIGDLTPLAMADDSNRATLQTSWERLRDLHATRFYHGHMPPQSFAQMAKHT